MAELEPKEFEGTGPVGTKKQFAIFLAVNTAIGIGLFYVLQNSHQTLAATIFIALVIGTLMFWRFRVAIAFIGIVILLLTRTIDLKHTIEFMSLDVIIFLVGMMVVVGMLRRSGFFRWLLAKGLVLSKFQPHRLFLIILGLSSLMAALVDEVTSILFITALVLDLCDFFDVSPVKYIISVVIATNIGSSWTVLGNPIGILIALRSGLTFEDFLKMSFPVGLISLIAIMVVLLFWQRGDLRLLKERISFAAPEERKAFLYELSTVTDKNLFKGSAAIFIAVIILLALHYRMELLMGLEHNTLLVAISVMGAGVVMLWQRPLARELLMRDVDWWTLIFFMFLFAKAGALQYTGVADRVGEALFGLGGGGNVPVLIVLILWISGLISAAADNVLVVATFIPMILYLTQRLGTGVLWWALLFGGCYGGNITMVGSTANIVALGVLEDRKGYHMTMKFWLWIGLWGGLLPMAIGTIALLIIR